RGLLDRHLVPPSHVLVTGPRRERRAELTKTYGVKALASNAEAATDAHVVVLSVKPQVLATVMRELRGKLDEDKLVISIVAGATLRSLRDGLDHAAIVRAMPNTPAQVGMGAAAIYQLEKGALRTVLSKAVYAAYQRTRELGAEAERRMDERP